MAWKAPYGILAIAILLMGSVGSWNIRDVDVSHLLDLGIANGPSLAAALNRCPEEDMSTPQLIRNANFKAETHEVTTKDGYNLKIHRIPNPGKEVVFLQHGLLCSSADWVINSANQSLGFILAENKYDVWIGNFRGNTYSRSNVHFKPDEKRFWMFSWDEMASIDLPTMIDYVLQNTTSKSLYYVGHSMGTTTAFALFSSQPEYSKKIKMFFALAPVAKVAHMESPIRYLANIQSEIEFIMDVFGIYEFLPHSKIVEILSDIVCKDLSQKELCADTIFLLCGFDKAQLNETRLPIYFAHTPAGTSTKTVLHYAQLYLSKGFTKYDFGSSENMKKYGQKNPPAYNLGNMTVRTILYAGDNDWLADPKDVSTLKEAIKNALVKTVEVAFKGWDHLDFIWGIQAKKYIYDSILEEIAKDIRKEK